MTGQIESHPESDDIRIERLLASLRPVPERQHAAQLKGINQFEAELDRLFENSPAEYGWMSRWKVKFNQKKEINNMSAQARKPVMAVIAALIAVLVFLFGSMGITAFAAQSALPGDSLYGVKTSLELTRVNLQGDLAVQAQMYMDLAQLRLNEIEALIQAGRFTDIDQAVAAFTTHIQMALQTVNQLSASDPQRAAGLNLEITATLSRFANTLGSMLASVPDPVKPQLDPALVTIQSSSDDNSNDVNTNDVNSNDANANDENENEVNSNDDGSNANDDNSNTDDENENENEVNSNDDDSNSNDDNSNISDDNTNSNDDSGDGSDDSGSGGGDDDGGSGSGGDESGDDSSGSGGSAWIQTGVVTF
jgi:uncharacterized membrane protein YgcG